MAEYIDRAKLKEDSEYNSVSGEYLSYSRGQIWNAPTEKVIDISVLDKIRAEIEEYKSRQLTLATGVDDLEKGKQIALEYVLAVLDKYKSESEK